jgi:hypothetical protein
MPRFKKHFTLAEARAQLPQLKRRFQELYDLRDAIKAGAPRHAAARESDEGNGGGGEGAGAYMETNIRFQQIIRAIQESGIQVKDLDRGLVDFPHLRDGQEVFLCWQLGEDTISYWHEIEAGYAGRRLLES